MEAAPVSVRRWDVGDASVHDLNPAQSVARVLQLARQRAPRSTVVTPNVAHLRELENNPRFRAAYERADLVLPDGWPIVAAMRLLGAEARTRVTGSDLVPAVLAEAAQRGLTVGIVGGLDGIGECAARNAMARWPGLRVCLVNEPPKGFERAAVAVDALCTAIRAANPDVLVLALGAPKQEIFAIENAERLGCGVAICAGAAVDFLAGSRDRAPKVVQRVGLEWLYRMMAEPRRLASRYLGCVPTAVSILTVAIKARLSRL